MQVLEALLDLHSRRIVHRDLKPENLLFYDNTENSKIVVVDFGLSEYEEELNEESPVCGTATYLAPEVISLPVINTITTSVLSQVIAQTESSRAQDLWSCGVITYIMVRGGWLPSCQRVTHFLAFSCVGILLSSKTKQTTQRQNSSVRL